MPQLQAVLALGLLALPHALSGQEPAEPVLRGSVSLNDAPLTAGTVVLHHLDNDSQGEIDSTTVDASGAFTLPLPNVPDPARGDVFFASVRHHDVLYFGRFVTQPIQLDSVYHIEAFDTAYAPAAGMPLPIQLRATFFEPTEVGWQVTDVFDLVNETERTLVAQDGGMIWSYPLPEGATGFTTGAAESGPDAVTFEGGAVRVHAPMTPGPRRVAVRYLLTEKHPEIPTPEPIEYFELFLREPAPDIEVEGLAATERVEIEAGTTYRHYTAENFADASVALIPVAGSGPPPVEWMAVVLALALAGFGVFTMRRVAQPGGGAAPDSSIPAQPGGGRTAVLLEIARLDEAFEAAPSPNEAERAHYLEERERLLERARRA